jgi:hypothetical protein
MASVSRAGMSSRRADAAPDIALLHVRFARTRGTSLITIRAAGAQSFPRKYREILSSNGSLQARFTRQRSNYCRFTKPAKSHGARLNSWISPRIVGHLARPGFC